MCLTTVTLYPRQGGVLQPIPVRTLGVRAQEVRTTQRGNNAYLPLVKKPTIPPWDVIDRLIMQGELSLRAIADDHHISEGAIRKRMKARGLVRTLGKRIARRAEQKLMQAVGNGLDRAQRAKLRQEVRRTTAGPRPIADKIAADVLEAAEERQVENAATAIATIIGHHRAEAYGVQKLVVQLVGDLTEAARHRFDVHAIIDAHMEARATRTDPETGEVIRVKVDEKRLNSMLAAIGLPAHAKAAKQLVDALDKCHEIARRAWGIETSALPPPPPAAGDSELLQDIRALSIAWNNAQTKEPAK